MLKKESAKELCKLMFAILIKILLMSSNNMLFALQNWKRPFLKKVKPEKSLTF